MERESNREWRGEGAISFAEKKVTTSQPRDSLNCECCALRGEISPHLLKPRISFAHKFAARRQRRRGRGQNCNSNPLLGVLRCRCLFPALSSHVNLTAGATVREKNFSRNLPLRKVKFRS